ncbi:MAG: hypothetical protein ABEJ81_03910 [Haloferacaceae archaeon]
MAEDVRGDGSTGGEGEVMASIDHSGPVPLVVIADVSNDEAWIAITASEAPDLAAWR